MNDLLAALEGSDTKAALTAYDERVAAGSSPWEIHLRLFPSVQRVLNPPFINPHLPKMHAICRRFAPLLDRDTLAGLVRVEVSEYARRPKLAFLPKPHLSADAGFDSVLVSLKSADVADTAQRMASFCEREGWQSFAGRMLLLGSGYLEKSLGHSLSCTAFILLEGMERGDADRWPVFVLLADYFHKGGFDTMPSLTPEPLTREEMDHQLLRGVSGGGLVDLHDTLTLFAVDSVRPLLDDAEYRHLLRSWIGYLEDKDAVPVGVPAVSPPESYEEFSRLLRSLELLPSLSAAAAILGSAGGGETLLRYLVKWLCEMYRGLYNPHHLTGLGALQWVIGSRCSREVTVTALHQYLDYLLGEMRRNGAGP